VADLGPLRIPLRADWLADAGLSGQQGAAFRIGIRPEYVSLAPADDPANPPVAHLDAVEPMGSECRLVMMAGDLEISARVPTDASLVLPKVPGPPLALKFDPNWIYLFDPQDGRTRAMAAASNPGPSGRPS
jgi:multiple sugar transport system ATP-binding protein